MPDNSEPVILDNLTVPDGKFEAPNDSVIYKTRIQIGNEIVVLPTIEQLSEGNCAEYSALNMALMSLYFDFSIGDELQTFLDQHSMPEAKDVLEAGYILHMLNYFHSITNPCGFTIQPSDRDNLTEKKRNIYESLTSTNSALIYWSMLNSTDSKCPKENLATTYTPELETRITSTPNLAIDFADIARAHATGIFKYHGHYFSIDSIRKDNVIKSETEETIIRRIKDLLQNGNGYIILSDLHKNESRRP